MYKIPHTHVTTEAMTTAHLASASQVIQAMIRNQGEVFFWECMQSRPSPCHQLPFHLLTQS